MIGRKPEVERLTALVEAAGQGQGASALVSGEAGIGKGELVSAVVEAASSSGFDVLTCHGIRERCWRLSHRTSEATCTALTRSCRSAGGRSSPPLWRPSWTDRCGGRVLPLRGWRAGAAWRAPARRRGADSPAGRAWVRGGAAGRTPAAVRGPW
ncbi:ATP-binding protein [Streptomyces sp. R39]|uniref:ATP-binding protein n=1 Tax=Streptomyces sp. R39 TaxID=3238631 RepID=A0AB39QFE4_9ACTN